MTNTEERLTICGYPLLTDAISDVFTACQKRASATFQGKEILGLDEIVRICKCAQALGISKIKLTGGEPLVRKICVPLVKELKAISGISQVTLTTNGILLKEQLPGLWTPDLMH